MTLEGKHLGALTELILHDQPSMKTEVQKEMKPYWSFRDEIAIIDGTSTKGKRIIIATSLQKRKYINYISGIWAWKNEEC